MEVVIDTCVFIDAIFDQLSNESCWEVLHLVRKKDIVPVICEGLANEYIFVPSKVAIETLKERFQHKSLVLKDFKVVQQNVYDCSSAMLKIIMDNSREVKVKSDIKACTLDPGDDKLINLATDANCGIIVTKNLRHFKCIEEKNLRTKSGLKIEVYTPQQLVNNFKLLKWADRSKVK